MHVLVHVLEIYFVYILKDPSLMIYCLFIAYLRHIYSTDFIFVYINLSDCGLIISSKFHNSLLSFQFFNFDS